MQLGSFLTQLEKKYESCTSERRQRCRCWLNGRLDYLCGVSIYELGVQLGLGLASQSQKPAVQTITYDRGDTLKKAGTFHGYDQVFVIQTHKCFRRSTS